MTRATTTQVVVYARVSTGRQEREETVKTQLDVVRQYCEREHIDFSSAVQFRDEGWSGDKTLLNERPQGQALLQAALRGEVDTVLVYKRDRLGRGGNARPAEAQFAAFGVRVISVTEPYVQTRMGKRADDFQSGSYLDQFRANTMHGRARRVREGRYIIPDAPYGYRRAEDDEGKTVLAVREDQAAVIRRIYQLYLEGDGHKKIAGKLDKAGVPLPSAELPPVCKGRHLDACDDDGCEGCMPNKRRSASGVWQGTRVRKYLLNSVYRGEWHYRARDPDDDPDKTEDIIIEVPPIIDAAVWERAQELHRRRGTDSPTSKYFYLLKRLLYCEACGSRISPYSAREGARYYKCIRAAHYSHSRSVKALHKDLRTNWPAATLEKVAKGFVQAWFADPERLLPHVEQRLSALQRQAEAEVKDTGAHERTLADLEQQEARVLEGWTRGVYTDAEQLKKQLEPIRAAQAQVARQLKAARRGVSDKERVVVELMEMRAAVGQLFFDKTVDGELTWQEPRTEEEWQKLLRYLVDRITVRQPRKDSKLAVRFEGVLAIPSEVEAVSSPVNTANPPSR